MRKSIVVVLLLLLAVGIGVGVFFWQRGVEVHIPKSDIQRKLAERLPFKKQYLQLVDLTIDTLTVDFKKSAQASNVSDARAAVAANVQVQVVGVAPLNLQVQGSAGLRYEAEQGDFYLDQFQLDSLTMDRLDAKQQALVKTALSTVMSQYLKQHPAFHLNTQKSKQAVAKAVLKSIRIDDADLIVALGSH